MKKKTCSLSPDQLNRLKVKYELQVLEKIIFSDLDPKHVAKQVNKAAWLKKCGREISLEVERIIAVIREEVLNCDSEIRITRYIQQHQHGIIKMMDHVQSYITNGGMSSIPKRLAANDLTKEFEKVLASFGQFLSFIQNNYPAHFDRSLKIPDCTRRSLFNEIIRLLKQVEEQFQESGIDEELTAFVLQPFHFFLEIQSQVSHRDFEFVLICQKELNNLLDRGTISDGTVQVMLMNINFNDPAFAFYILNKMKDTGRQEHDHAELGYYRMQLKILHQKPKKQGLAYDPSITSIHNQLGTWLAEEIYYLERNLQRTANVPETKIHQEVEFEKLETTLSVASLSLGIKLLLDARVIINSNTREVMRLVSRCFRTEYAEKISEDSLRNKAYNVDSRAAEGVRDVIIKMLNEVRRY